MTPVRPRLAHELNAALGDLLADYTDLFVLGEDIADPYGGAFKITKGLSARFPGRVRTTPISEAGIVGVANGLALTGHRVIVEIMFADFVTLAFDQIVNMAAKSVSMYGRRAPMPVAVRCPSGGGRGYGPTHSQSPQKFFLGVPDLRLYELTLFHPPGAVLRAALAAGVPALVFEPKLLYPRRMINDGDRADGFVTRRLGDPMGWMSTDSGQDSPADVTVIAAGGCYPVAAEAAATARAAGVAVQILTPAMLYPVRLDEILPVLTRSRRVVIVDEGTAGAGWGATLAHELTSRLWTGLLHPPLVVASRDSVIPAASHLERETLVQPGAVLAAILRSHDTAIGPR